MSQRRTIGVIGLGYVGLPVATAFAAAGFRTIGFEIDQSRVDELRRGHDRTGEVAAEVLRSCGLELTTAPSELAEADFYIITVPTPIDDASRPDLSALKAASNTVGAVLKRGDIVVFECTVYPGCTEEDCAPILERVSGLASGADFFLGYSPERINPGDHEHRFETITKVVSGQTPESTKIVAETYGAVVRAGVHVASSIKVAEAAKVIENTQRDLNIALMNELSLILQRMGVDTLDVLEAAGTKWNFLRFTPGLVGGHCIGVDPYYLTHKAQQLGYHPEVVLAGRRVNDDMGRVIARECVRRLVRMGRPDPTVTVLGVTFKEDVPDVRNSRVFDILSELKSFGVNVQAHDPIAHPGHTKHEYGVDLTPAEALAPADAIVFAVAHRPFAAAGWDFVRGLLRREGGAVLDVKGRLPRDQTPADVSLWRP
jgi:UDP-N-acetyl-D-galactosamine dehydrogenase